MERMVWSVPHPLAQPDFQVNNIRERSRGEGSASWKSDLEIMKRRGFVVYLLVGLVEGEDWMAGNPRGEGCQDHVMFIHSFIH